MADGRRRTVKPGALRMKPGALRLKPGVLRMSSGALRMRSGALQMKPAALPNASPEYFAPPHPGLGGGGVWGRVWGTERTEIQEENRKWRDQLFKLSEGKSDWEPEKAISRTN